MWQIISKIDFVNILLLDMTKKINICFYNIIKMISHSPLLLVNHAGDRPILNYPLFFQLYDVGIWRENFQKETLVYSAITQRATILQ